MAQEAALTIAKEYGPLGEQCSGAPWTEDQRTFSGLSHHLLQGKSDNILFT